MHQLQFGGVKDAKIGAREPLKGGGGLLDFAISDSGLRTWTRADFHVSDGSGRLCVRASRADREAGCDHHHNHGYR